MEYTFHDQVSSITQYNTITWRRLLSSKKSLRCRGSCKPRKNFSHKIKSWLAVTFWRSLSEKLAQVLHKMLLCVCLGIVQKLRTGVKVSEGPDSDTV